ncbi:MAG: aldo/keto reductase [Nocardioidaceae bacterium]|nr:aldo/keto reductase [Nocardioidaceae bacterium]
MTDHAPTVPTDVAALPGGGSMPLLGFGTWQLKGSAATDATRWALEAGYRHVDTAHVYGNEAAVGAALASAAVDRDDIFVTTKVPPDRLDARQTLQQSLDELGVDHVDLWLIHWPPSGGGAIDRWRELVQAQAAGLARDIGVSNFSLDAIDALSEGSGVRPAVNQVEWSPLLFDSAELDGHRERGIVLEGYSALRGGTLEHPDIVGIAERLGRSPAQVIVRWHLEHGVVVIPKSQQRERIAANADVGDFTLSADDVAALDGLGSSG